MADTRSSRIQIWGITLIAVAVGGLAAQARAQATTYDPRAFDLRMGLFPVAFQAGIVQNHFGSAARAEVDVHRLVSVGGFGRVRFLALGRLKDEAAYAAGAIVHVHLSEYISEEGLAGTVYPEDAPAVGGGAPAGDDLMGLSPSQKLGGPRLTLPEVDRSLTAYVRTAHSLRASYTLTRLGLRYLQRVRDPDTEEIEQEEVFAVSRQHALGLGYAWSTHWNLHVGDEAGREVGFRRLYGDLMVAPHGLVDLERRYESTSEREPTVSLFGMRMGMEGTIAGMWSFLPGAGLAYTLELAGWYGEGHVDGQLFVALGLALDMATGGDR